MPWDVSSYNCFLRCRDDQVRVKNNVMFRRIVFWNKVWSYVRISISMGMHRTCPAICGLEPCAHAPWVYIYIIMYIFIYTHIVYIYACMYVCIYICIYIYIYIYMRKRMCTLILVVVPNMYVCMYVCMYGHCPSCCIKICVCFFSVCMHVRM
jgi:hypothetical protein